MIRFERAPAIFPAGLVIDVRPQTFEDLEAHAARWNLTSYQLERGTYSAVLQAVHSPRVQLGRTWRALRTFLEARIPAGSILISFPANERTALCFRGHPLGRAEAALAHHSEQLEAAIGGRSDVVTLAVSAEELERRAQVLWHRTFPRPGRHGTVSFRGDGAAGAWFLQVLEETLPEAGALSGERVARAFEDRVLDHLFALLEQPGPVTDSMGRHRLARRAEEYLRAHCRDDLSLADLCAATGATRRTLHLGFCEVYGLSPMQYLKALRLSKVRRDILTPSEGLSVTDAAMRWGFCHLGRFAGDYREFFGRLPSAERALNLRTAAGASRRR